MRDEYDLRGPSKRSSYAKRIGEAGRAELLARFREAEHLVRLDDDLALLFPTEASVNEALRLFLRLRGAVPRKPAGRTVASAAPPARRKAAGPKAR